MYFACKMRVWLLIAVSIVAAACGGASENSKSVRNHAFQDSLQNKLSTILKKYKAKVGVAIISIEDRDTILIQNNHPYPTQSVYKFPLAITVLHMVDQGKFTLNQKIEIKKEDLHTKTWSPLRDSFPNGIKEMPLQQLLRYTVSLSDNNGCDILFKLIGGTQVADAYIKSLGLKNISIAATEAEMHTGWEPQFKNWFQPLDMAALLDGVYQKKYLSDSCNQALIQMLTETNTGPKRIKGLLPAETIVAHKTGTGGDNDHGLTAAVNDVGIIYLPNGKHIALVVFVSDTYENLDTNELIIATIAKTTYDAFMAKKP